MSPAKVLAALTATFVALLGLALPARVTAVAPGVRVIAISYRAHDGLPRRAYLILPAWYGPTFHPAIPLVISPHGRGVSAEANIRRWGRLPAVGGFAVINPDRKSVV